MPNCVEVSGNHMSETMTQLID